MKKLTRKKTIIRVQWRKPVSFTKRILKSENITNPYWPFHLLHHYFDESQLDWEDINKQFKEGASQ